MALVFVFVVVGFFERLGHGYFCRWYVQQMLPFGTGISLYAHI